MQGEIGRQDYDALTMREVSLIMQGYQDRQVHDYRQTRLIMFVMTRLLGDSKKAPKTPEELWELPGDVKGNPREEEILELLKQFREKHGRAATD